jgi:hypothetical protein
MESYLPCIFITLFHGFFLSHIPLLFSYLREPRILSPEIPLAFLCLSVYAPKYSTNLTKTLSHFYQVSPNQEGDHKAASKIME